MSEQKRYTAEELRRQAHDMDEVVVPSFSIREVGSMLRQAADAEEEIAQLKARLKAVVKEIEGRDWINDSDLADSILRIARGDGGAE